jgi:hypothetical protein
MPRLLRSVDGLSSAAACGLVGTAISRLAVADSARDGFLAADTALVSSAAIGEMEQRDFSGRRLGEWWVITLDLRDRAYNAEVRVSRRDGALRLRPVHKPL